MSNNNISVRQLTRMNVTKICHGSLHMQLGFSLIFFLFWVTSHILFRRQGHKRGQTNKSFRAFSTMHRFHWNEFKCNQINYHPSLFIQFVHKKLDVYYKITTGQNYYPENNAFNWLVSFLWYRSSSKYLDQFCFMKSLCLQNELIRVLCKKRIYIS